MFTWEFIVGIVYIILLGYFYKSPLKLKEYIFSFLVFLVNRIIILILDFLSDLMLMNIFNILAMMGFSIIKLEHTFGNLTTISVLTLGLSLMLYPLYMRILPKIYRNKPKSFYRWVFLGIELPPI
jgi:hypothetical protein